MKFVTLRRERTHPRGEYISHYKRRELVMTKSIQTLTQSGMLAVLLQRQRYKVFQLARQSAHRKRVHGAFWNTLTRARLAVAAPKPVDAGAPHLNRSPGDVP
jgi:hypothetical protein